MKTAKEYFEQGDLNEALKTMSQELTEKPSDISKRAFYIELLCINGDYEKADRQLDIMTTLDPSSVLVIGKWRQLIRAAQARKDVYLDGAIPEVIDTPTERIKALLETQLALREGDEEKVTLTTRDLEDSRLPYTAIVNGNTVNDIRDIDDSCAGILEVLGTNGNYYWVDFSQIKLLEFTPPERPIDLIWRKAEIVLNNGTEGEVYIPSIYITAKDNASKLGRKTEWDETSGMVHGIGQRSWLSGEEALSIMELEKVVFTNIEGMH